MAGSSWQRDGVTASTKDMRQECALAVGAMFIIAADLHWLKRLSLSPLPSVLTPAVDCKSGKRIDHERASETHG